MLPTMMFCLATGPKAMESAGHELKPLYMFQSKIFLPKLILLDICHSNGNPTHIFGRLYSSDVISVSSSFGPK
jgi:hypothetical protein